ncbi:hypothetical protein CBL_06010 [Carabus blaptoides fortunei]
MKCLILVCSITLIRSVPIGNDCLEENIHGIIVEEEIPKNKVYPAPQYIAPVIIDGSPDLHLTATDLSKDGYVGYAAAENLQGKLMPVVDFNQKYQLPENVKMKVVENAKPVFDIEE